MDRLIYPSIWCKTSAKDVADYYVSVFKNTEIVDDNGFFKVLNIHGHRIKLLEGEVDFELNPSISLMYLTPSETEVEELYEQLIVGGNTLMPLDSYPFSSKYAWVEDKHGVSWQLITAEEKDIIQKIVPTIMMLGENNGKAENAISFYTSLFPNSEKRGVSKYTDQEGETPGNIQHAEFKINDYLLMIMDSSQSHSFNFNEAVSLVIECDTQDEIDHYWDKLTADGGEESVCGWLKDKYGVRWQVEPKVLNDLLQKTPKVFEVMLTMKKLNIKQLKEAAEE